MPSIRELLQIVARIAEEKGHSTPYLVGGIPRDKLLGRLEDIQDADITTGDDTIHQLAQDVYKELASQGANIKILGDGHAQITIDQVKLDFSSNYRSSGLEQMLERVGVENPNDMLLELLSRDFTCNALLLTLDLQTIKDPTGLGLNDVRRKLLRTCLPARITLANDHKRVIRIFYLAAKLGFDVDDEIKEWVRNHPEAIADVKPKYLADKLSQAVSYDKERVVQLLDEMKIWAHIPMLSSLTNEMTEPTRILASKFAQDTKLQKALEMSKKHNNFTIVDSARGKVGKYKDLDQMGRSGIQRINFDVRPMGRFDAIFKNFDYSLDKELDNDTDSPGGGMYYRMKEFESISEFDKYNHHRNTILTPDQGDFDPNPPKIHYSGGLQIAKRASILQKLAGFPYENQIQKQEEGDQILMRDDFVTDSDNDHLNRPANKIDNLKLAKRKINIEELKQLPWNDVFDYITNSGAQYLGGGSSRDVYVLSPKYVIKVAKNEPGEAQNKAELELSNKYSNIFTNVILAHPMYWWIISELAKPFGRGGWSEFEQAAGLDFFEFTKFIYENQWKQSIDESELSSKPDFIKNLLSLIHNGELSVMDTTMIENWGKTADGRLVLVDYGGTKPVIDKYYSGDRGNTPAHISVIEQANTATNYEILRDFASHQDSYVRRQVANNPNTPTDILEKLMNDIDDVVRQNAEINLNKNREDIQQDENDAKDSKKKKDEKRVSLDTRPGFFTSNYDYGEPGVGTSMYRGPMDRFDSVTDFLEKSRKERAKKKKDLDVYASMVITLTQLYTDKI